MGKCNFAPDNFDAFYTNFKKQIQLHEISKILFLVFSLNISSFVLTFFLKWFIIHMKRFHELYEWRC